MTEVGQADLSRLLQTKRIEHAAIVAARKRKLRQLFAVATHVDRLPDDAFANPDAPAPTSAEWKFLQASDITQGRTLNESNIPARQAPSLDKLKQSLPSAFGVSTAQPSATAAPTPTSAPTPTLAPTPAATPVGNVKKKESSVRPPRSPAVPWLKDGQSPSGSRSSFTPATSTPGTPSSQPQKASQSPATSQTQKLTPLRSASPVVVDAPNKVKSQTSAGANVKSSTQPTTPQKIPSETKPPPSVDTTRVVPKQHAAPHAVPEKARNVTAMVPIAVNSPVRWTKPSEHLSSPACSPRSVTTPVVPASSTDTSPDAEDASYFASTDSAEPRRESAEAGGQGKIIGVHGQQHSTTDDQILQRQSSDSRTTPAETKNLNEFAKDGMLAKTKTLQAPGVTKQKKWPEPRRLSGADIADAVSQPGSPEEEMVGDSLASRAIQWQKSQKILSPRHLNLSSHSAPTSPRTTKKDQSSQLATVERAVTRVSSGAMRLKSVNEIVGGSFLRQPSTLDRDDGKAVHDQLTPVTSTPQSPASRVKPGQHRRKRSKGQFSTVLFGKHPKRMDEKSVVAGHKETMHASDDYYTPLFVHNFTGSTNWMQPMEKILFQANKTIATRDANLVILDHQACRVLRRVYHLQQHDKWSLRQPKRCPEPTRPPTQWDVLLKEMKWMRTDFREERKWKMTVARNLAHACAEWHEATLDERKEMQVAANSPPKTTTTPATLAREVKEDVSVADVEAHTADNQPTPDLVSSGDVDSPQVVDDELKDDFAETVSPTIIFALQEDDVVFELRRTTASDALLDELPMYGSPLHVPKGDMINPEYDPDAHWRRPALPLSKYVEGEMRVLAPKIPGNRSRFDYNNEESEESEDDGKNAFAAKQVVDNAQLPPVTNEVALFHPDSKHIRDRLHAGHQFRPPSEHPMPLQTFYECRGPSQWTLVEDDELRGLVREYSYNWSLISSMLSTKSRFQSGAERRSPWECFERWISLEGLPSDMQKTQYFKAYNTRIEAAQRVISQQNQMTVQQATASGGTVTPVRRRQSLPLRVERRRNQKHLTLIDAMRKLAKKRETTLQKHQHSASQNSVNKKTNDTLAQRPRKTPRDYSILRWERDQALAEKMAQYAQRQEAQRRAALQARAHGQAAQAAAAAGQPGAPGAPGVGATVPTGTGPNGPTGQAAGVTQGQNNVNGLQAANVAAAIARPNIPTQLAAAAAAAAAAQGRPRVPMQAPVNGVGVGTVQTPMNGGLSAPSQMTAIQQAQIQAALQAQQRMPMPNQQPDANLMLRAQRISEQQRAQIHQVQHQQHQQHQQHPQPQPHPHPHHSQQHPQQHAQQLLPHHQQPIQANSGATAVTGQHTSPALRNGVNGANGANGVTGVTGVGGINGINGINGIAQQSYMTTAQAMMAQYSAAAAAAAAANVNVNANTNTNAKANPNPSVGANTNANANTNPNQHSSPPPPQPPPPPPSANGLHMPASATAASPGPRMHSQLPPTILAQLAALEGTFRAKNPSLSPEQARQLATEHLTRAMMAQRQSAMASAAGGTGQSGLANGIAATTSPHQYAALLRQQQQQQAALQQQAQQKAAQAAQAAQAASAVQAASSAQAAQQAQQRAGSQASPTPGPAASPVQSHQRQSSGSATPGGQ
ncbi:hypothetical protein E4U55_002973 [Claviceps digitariae]|nr:hypothetical protein E4U55_002973 [Claviceps digitariae]